MEIVLIFCFSLSLENEMKWENYRKLAPHSYNICQTQRLDFGKERGVNCMELLIYDEATIIWLHLMRDGMEGVAEKKNHISFEFQGTYISHTKIF